jgi:hypothetical protein
MMKSNAKLRCEDHDEAPQPPPIHVEMLDIASSSQTALPLPKHDVGYVQILAALASLQRGMSSMQQAVSSINLRVE